LSDDDVAALRGMVTRGLKRRRGLEKSPRRGASPAKVKPRRGTDPGREPNRGFRDFPLPVKPQFMLQHLWVGKKAVGRCWDVNVEGIIQSECFCLGLAPFI